MGGAELVGSSQRHKTQNQTEKMKNINNTTGIICKTQVARPLHQVMKCQDAFSSRGGGVPATYSCQININISEIQKGLSTHKTRRPVRRTNSCRWNSTLAL